jgi:hypothetical protein
MFRSTPPCSEAIRPKPRMGIFVDCKPIKTKRRQAALAAVPAPPDAVAVLAVPVLAVPVMPPVAIHAPPALARPLCSRIFAVAALALGLFLTAASLSAWLAAPVVQDKPRVAQTQAVTAAHTPKLKAKTAVKPVAKKEPILPPAPAAVAPPPAPAAEVQNSSGSEPAAPAADVVRPAEKVEVVKLEAVADKKLVKDPAPKEDGPTCTTGTCNKSGDFFGTAVTFAASPKIAGEQALEQRKLLFVLHVSGNFEDPGFT